MLSRRDIPASALATLLLAAAATAAGVLSPLGSADLPIQIQDHEVHVTILGGFATTEVVQVFFNPNDHDCEAIYSFPVPRSASLSEMTITSGETEMHGEVVARERARQVYEAERDAGAEVGLAEKNSFQDFRFFVANVHAQTETRVRFLYYQPLEIDTGVGRYLYPLEAGGTDDAGSSFWTRNEKVERTFSISVELRSEHPVEDVRCPGFETAALIDKRDEGHYVVEVSAAAASLSRDFVFYYRLVDGLPGRVELIPYRDGSGAPGTFMMVLTPGLDLQPLQRGVDTVFVLDISGSMEGKIGTLARGVSRVIGDLDPSDRFRIVIFNDSAQDLLGGWQPATESSVAGAIAKLEALIADGSTNLYDGMEKGLAGLDADRATNFILVTDAVTNTGIVDPGAFDKLLRKVDVRVFGFLLGNSANWPLMNAIAEASGGFYAQVSNADDIQGQILLAKSKVTHECLHDARIKIKGVKTFDVTREAIGKVYRGQQLVIFGRYEDGGAATVELTASLTGEDRTYTTTFDFPVIDHDFPEVERLWALARIEGIKHRRGIGAIDGGEASTAVADLGVAYQLVTDETSMIVLDDERFATHGIDRANQERIAREQAAKVARAAAPVRNTRVDASQPAFSHSSPTLGGGGGGGGALDLSSTLIVLAGVALVLLCGRRRGV